MLCACLLNYLFSLWPTVPHKAKSYIHVCTYILILLKYLKWSFLMEGIHISDRSPWCTNLLRMSNQQKELPYKHNKKSKEDRAPFLYRGE